MTPFEVGELMQGVGVLIGAVASVWGLRIGHRNTGKIDAVHKSTNSRMDELIEMNRKEATATEKQRGEDVRTGLKRK